MDRNKSTTAWQYEQICNWLKAGINGDVHWVQDIWDTNFSTYNCFFKLVNTKNAFNNINCIAMLWTVCHLCLTGAHFCTLNSHCSFIILRNGNGTTRFLHSIEGVNQGNPLAMVAYGIGVIPLINTQKWIFLTPPQPWYADNTSALGTFANSKLYFNYLKRFGPGCGYCCYKWNYIHMEQRELVAT